MNCHGCDAYLSVCVCIAASKPGYQLPALAFDRRASFPVPFVVFSMPVADAHARKHFLASHLFFVFVFPPERTLYETVSLFCHIRMLCALYADLWELSSFVGTIISRN